MYKTFIAAMLLAVCSGCLPSYTELAKQSYNIPESGKSDFDNTSHIRVSQIACIKESNAVIFELYQDDTLSKAKQVLLTAKATPAKSIADGNSLLFNIDGTISGFKSIDSVTEYKRITLGTSRPSTFTGGTYVPGVYQQEAYVSSKRYVVSEETVKVLAGAKRIVTKLLLDNTYIEAMCTPPEKAEPESLAYQASASQGFKKFSKMMEAMPK